MTHKRLILGTATVAAILGVALFSGCKSNTANNEEAKETTEAKVEPKAGAIVYFQLDKVIREYDRANELKSVVETKVSEIEAEMQRKGKKLEADVRDFEEKLNKGLMTRVVAESNGQKLQQRQVEFQNWVAQKEQEIQEENFVMTNQINNDIQKFVTKFNEDKDYAMILANQGDISGIINFPVLVADPSLDITDAIIKGLNEEYIKSKDKK